MKAFLSIGGLLLDVVGAFLLSIPMIWNIEKFHSILYRINSFRVDWSRYEAPLVLIGNLPLAGILISEFLGLGSGYVLTFAFLPVLTFVAVVSFYLFVIIPLEFFGWILRDRETRERTVGRTGLFLLCIGFGCQAAVNLMD